MVFKKDVFSTRKFSRYMKVSTYISFLRDNYKPRSADEDEIKKLEKIIELKLQKIKVFHYFQGFSYAVAYFSLVSAVLPETFFVEILGDVFRSILAIFGVGVFLFLALALSFVLNLKYQELNLYMAHLISLYTQGKIMSEVLGDVKK